MNHTGSIQLFLDTCHLIHAKGLVSGSGGNISLRCDDGILITPSGRSLESLKEEDLVLLQMDGSYTCPNGGIPSKEWRMHLACYHARPDVSALVHVHSSNAVAVSCMKDADSSCAIPVYTPGYSMRVGELPLLHRRAQLGASGKSRSFGRGPQHGGGAEHHRGDRGRGEAFPASG